MKGSDVLPRRNTDNAKPAIPPNRLPVPAGGPLEAPIKPRSSLIENPLFDEFYASYPRKTGKQGARREWHRITSLRVGVDPQRVIAAAQRFRDECRAKGTDPKYIPHPASWLHDGRYEDEPSTPSAPQREWQAPAWQSDEQLMATVIRLAADHEHPVSAADAIVRAIRAQLPAGIPEGFPFVSPERGRELAAMRYADYLLTPEWEARRKAMLKAAGYRCMVCNRDRVTNVHHRTYERRGVEHPSDLIVLCDECHMLFHRHGHLHLPAEGEVAPMIPSPGVP